MRLPRKDPWWFAVAWMFGFPVVVWLGGIVWTAVSCDEQVALCAGGMQWFGFIVWGGIAWFVGTATIANLLAMSNRRPRTRR